MPATTRAITLGRYSGRKMRGSIDGTEAQPGFFYADDDDTGIFSPSDGNVSLTLDGVTTTKWEDGLTTFVGDIAIDDSIIHIGDTDTKIRFPATDTFTIETAGVEALRVDSNQDTTLAGTLFGPATFIIDPATAGDNTGTVKIQGDLTVEGVTTTINSTELTVDDINITIAAGAADAAAANGAGITIDGASATLTYQSTPNQWEFDRSLKIDGDLNITGTVETGTWEATPIEGAYIADDAIDSQHYADGSIDNQHIADDQIDSEHYAAGSIDGEHLAADIIDGSKIADDVIDSEHYVAGSIDNEHLADDAVDSDELAAGAVDLTHLSATGTTDATTYLRGDNTWATVVAGATTIVTENQRTIDADYTIQTTMNALSVGPVSIDSGKTLTIPANSRYVVL